MLYGGMLCRTRQLTSLRSRLQTYPVVSVLGPRQVGKTTLARQLVASWPEPTTFFDLEDPVDQRRLEDPGLALRPLRGLVVLDEVQRLPEVFPLLRVLADRPDVPARFLLLGSAAPELMRGVSESLAGRVAFHDLSGLSVDEIGDALLDALWLRGGFPRAFLARDDQESFDWRMQFVRTFLERDLPLLGVGIPAATMRRFWTMLAHYHGQTWNGAELARAFGVSTTTVRRYLGYLEGAFVVRVVQPWFENLGKRQVKSPKVYLVDSGLLHALLGLRTAEELMGHPKVGASFEGFAMRIVTERLGVRPEETYFWSTHQGAEIDLFVERGGRRLGVEFKRTEAPKVTKSMRIAMEDLRLDRLEVVHAGEATYPMAEGIRALALRDVWEALEPL